MTNDNPPAIAVFNSCGHIILGRQRTKTYWFSLYGIEAKTKRKFHGSEYGICFAYPGYRVVVDYSGEKLNGELRDAVNNMIPSELIERVTEYLENSRPTHTQKSE